MLKFYNVTLVQKSADEVESTVTVKIPAEGITDVYDAIGRYAKANKVTIIQVMKVE